MCKHEFIGHAEGVKCSLCGLTLTTEEYRKYLKGEVKTEEKPKKTTKKK